MSLVNYSYSFSYGLNGRVVFDGLDENFNIPTKSIPKTNWVVHQNNSLSTVSAITGDTLMNADGSFTARQNGFYRVSLSVDIEAIGGYQGSIYAYFLYTSASGGSMNKRKLAVVNIGGSQTSGVWTSSDFLNMTVGDTLSNQFACSNALDFTINSPAASFTLNIAASSGSGI